MVDDAAQKKAAKEATALAASLSWPTEGYDLSIPYLLVYVLAVFNVFMDVLVLCSVRAHMFTYRYELRVVNAMFMIYLWIKSIEIANTPSKAKNLIFMGIF